jgi:hypothetical protein
MEVPAVPDSKHHDPAGLIQKAMQELASPGDAQPRPQPALTPQQQAARLRDMTYVADAFVTQESLPSGGDVPDFQVNLRDLLRDVRSLPDPIERMLVQLLVLTHHAIARLHARAGSSQRPEEVVADLEAAAQLTDEFGRMALTLKRHRRGRRGRGGD